MVQKQSTPDNNVNDPMKDLTATAGQGQQSGNQQSGQQQGSQQSGQQQQGNQQSQQSGRQQQGGQQGNQQSGGQHASGGTPALDDMDSQSQGESARDASQAFQQQDQRGGKR